MRHTYWGEVRFDPDGGFFRKWAWRVMDEVDTGKRTFREQAFGYPSKSNGRTFSRRSAVERAAALAAVLNDETNRGDDTCNPWEVV